MDVVEKPFRTSVNDLMGPSEGVRVHLIDHPRRHFMLILKMSAQIEGIGVQKENFHASGHPIRESSVSKTNQRLLGSGFRASPSRIR